MKNAILLLASINCCNISWAEDSDIVPIEGRLHEATEVDERTAKEALQYLLHNHAIPLSIHSSCSNVGMRGDKTIGDFTSGMLSQFVYVKGENSKNWISASCKNNPQSLKADPVRDCEITFHQARLEENVLWGWGFRFSAKKNSSTIIKKTMLCMVAG